MKAVILGAGKTGRGFIARLLHQAGVAVTLVDKNQQLVNQIRTQGGYTVHFFAQCAPPVVLENPPIYHTTESEAQAAIAQADILFVSVGPENLGEVAQMLERLFTGHPTEVVLCENAVNPSYILRGRLHPAVSITEGAIFCTTIEAPGDTPDILSENYPALLYNPQGIHQKIGDIPGFVADPQFEVLLKRKIYTYNAASAFACYLGYLRGYDKLGDAANDPAILEILKDFYTAINAAICKEYHIPPEQQARFARLSLEKFTNKEIVDSIHRNCRSPQRKLSSTERIAYPMQLLLKHGGSCTGLCLVAAAALQFGAQTDPDWQDKAGLGSPAEQFQRLSGISQPHCLSLVEKAWESLGSLPVSQQHLQDCYNALIS